MTRHGRPTAGLAFVGSPSRMGLDTQKLASFRQGSRSVGLHLRQISSLEISLWFEVLQSFSSNPDPNWAKVQDPDQNPCIWIHNTRSFLILRKVVANLKLKYSQCLVFLPNGVGLLKSRSQMRLRLSTSANKSTGTKF